MQAAMIPKKQEDRGLSWVTRFCAKVGWEGWLWAAGCRRAGLGLGVQGGGEACNLVPPYPLPRSPSYLHTLWGQCQVAWTPRRWPEAGALYRDQAPCCRTSSPCHLPAAAANP